MEVFKQSEIFEQKRSGNGKQDVKCKICNCWLHSLSEKIIQSHINGKKHKHHLHRLAQKENKMKHGVYVKGFDSLLDNLEEELRQFFQTIGGPIKDIYVDKNAGNYCIIEFCDLESVSRCLSSDKKTFHGNKLVIRQRESSSKSSPPSTSLSEGKSKKTNSTTTREDLDTKSTLLNKELETLLSSKPDIESELKALHEYLQLTTEEMEMRTLVCELLQSVLEEAYPGATVHMFGSSVNGLGVRDCDLDVTVLTATDESCDERPSNEIMKEMREIIERYAPGFKNVLLVESAKNCSIVKMCHTQSSLNIDLSLDNRLAIRNTALLKQYVNGNETLISLVFAIRHWAKLACMTGRSGMQISNYALTLMIIHYLQQRHPPYLECLQKCHPQPHLNINQWDCSFCKDHSPISKTDKVQSAGAKKSYVSSGDLLLCFFQFYINYRFEENVVAIHTAQLLKRTECSGHHINVATALVVQDPFKLSHNVAQNMSKNGLTAFQSACEEVYKAMSASTNESSSILTLFAPQQKTKQQNTKLKQRKRTRSNEYVISLPGCKHQSGDNEQCCYDFTKSILSNKLQMQIHAEPCGLLELQHQKKEEKSPNIGQIDSISQVKSFSAEITKGEKDVAVLNPAENTVDIVSPTNGTVRKRRHDGDGGTDNLDIKRRKTGEENSLQFYAYAFLQTWTNRRKERRRLKHSSSADCVSETNTGDNLTGVSNLDSSSSTPPNNDNDTNIAGSSKVQQQRNRTPKLCVNVALTKATGISDVCKLKLEPFSDDDVVQTELQDFQIFYAYLKKELVSVFK